MKYAAQERKWVARILVRLTSAQRDEYERECKRPLYRHRNGKLYDSEKARIAERIMYEAQRGTP